MIKRGFSLERCPVHNLFEATMFVMWTMVAAYLVFGIWSRLRFLGAFASPVLFAIGVFALLFGLVLWPRRVTAGLEAVAMRVLPRPLRRPVVDALEAFVAGASSLRDPRLLFRTAAWSLVLWLVNSIGFWLAFYAFDIRLPFTAALFFQSCIALGVSVPSAPGFFGAYEYVAKLVLADLWGTEVSKALGMALGFHIAGMIPVTLMGLYYAWRLGLSLRGVAQSETVVEEAVERQSGVDPDHPER
jgi:uncharacterized membrane protein YbhN (UPF0104 family)